MTKHKLFDLAREDKIEYRQQSLTNPETFTHICNHMALLGNGALTPVATQRGGQKVFGVNHETISSTYIIGNIHAKYIKSVFGEKLTIFDAGMQV